MKQIVQLLGCAVVGLLLALALGWRDVETTSAYTVLIWILLAVGLYGSTYGIDLNVARKHLRLIAGAVTVGVAVKAALIASVIVLVTGKPAYALLGVVVAQIDPLSTAAILNSRSLSKRVKTILGAWASFDDPVTVILVIYLTPLIGRGASHSGAGHLLGQYGLAFAENVAFVVVLYTVWRLLRRSNRATYSLLPLSLVVSVANSWALGIAGVGLFLRPPIDKLVGYAVKIALWAATILLGMLLISGVHIRLGIVLGVSAFGAHMLVSWLLTWHLPRNDRVHLAFAQQNGITAIILALLLEPRIPGAVAIVAPAILTTNSLHALAGKLLTSRSLTVLAPTPANEEVDTE